MNNEIATGFPVVEMLNAIDDIVILVNSQSNVTFVNKAGQNKLNEIGNQSQHMDVNQVLSLIGPCVNIKETLNNLHTSEELVQECFDEQEHHCYFLKIKSFNVVESQDVNYMILIRDVSEMKKAQQNEQEYKILIENQGEGIGTCDENDVFQFANPAAEEIFGVPKEGLKNRSVREFVTEEVFQTIQSQTNRRKKGEKSSYEIEIIRPDKQKRIVLVTASPRFDDKGNYLNSFGIFRDITQQKKAEQQLLKHQDMLKQGLTYQEVISSIALNFNDIRDFNQQVKQALQTIGQLLSVSRVYIFEESIEGTSMSNTFEWCDDDIEPQIHELQEVSYTIIPSWKKILTEKGIIFSENMYNLPEDIVQILEPQDIKSIVVFPLHIRGVYFGFVGFDECKKQRSWTKTEVEFLRTIAGIISNAYEREIIQNNLKKAKNKAEESDKLKSAFLANMSHEIRTPMNGIIGFADLLMNRDLREEQRSYYAKMVSDSCRQLLTIVTDILDLSRIETGQVNVKSEKISLNSLIMEIFRLYKHKIGERTLALLPFYALSDHTSLIFTDRSKLQQVLTHLMENAIKFTRMGHVKFGYEVQKNTLKFFVSDTGIGIPKQLHKEIFEPFRQAEMEPTREFGGTGLGLTISQKLIHLMGGQIWLESEVNQGSTFYFTIPYAPAGTEIEVDTGSDRLTNERFKGMKVLVAEDEETNYIYFEELLTDWGLEVIHARNGNEAVEMCERNDDIEMVFMDVKMPQLNGLDATKFIKEIKPNLTIVAQTAYAMLEDREKALQAGCDDYITKPIDQDKLFEIIRKQKNGHYN